MRSSFAKDFYSGNAPDGQHNNEVKSNNNSDSFRRSRPALERRQSSRTSLGRRQASRRWSTKFSDLDTFDSGTSLNASNGDSSSRRDSTGSINRRDSTGSINNKKLNQRQSSWMMNEEIQNFLLEDVDEGAVKESIAVLEQYRLMAHMEAYDRVRENCGFDPANMLESEDDDESKRKKFLYGGNLIPRMTLPPISNFDNLQETTQMEEPPPPVPNFKTKWIKQKQFRVPELCPGTVIVLGGSGNSMNDASEKSIEKEEETIIVRCLGCRVQLRVNALATLVKCPNCGTVSSATSTRR